MPSWWRYWRYSPRPLRHLVVWRCAILPCIVSNRESAERTASKQQHDKLSDIVICLRGRMEWNDIFSYISTCFLRQAACNIPSAQGQGHEPRSCDLVQTDSNCKISQFWKLPVRIQCKLYLLNSKEKEQECFKWEYKRLKFINSGLK